MEDDNDPMRESKGIAYGLALSILLWILILLAVGIFAG
jgi:hypothetical protein